MLYLQRGKAAFPPPCVPQSRRAHRSSYKASKIQKQIFFWGEEVYLQRGKAAFPPPCFLENRGLEGVWAPPWGVLEGSGRLLGGSWLQEASWVFCRLLSGGSWAAQEPSWGPRWTQVEGQDGSKILPRRPKMSLRCLQDCPRSDFQSKSKEK